MRSIPVPGCSLNARPPATGGPGRLTRPRAPHAPLRRVPRVRENVLALLWLALLPSATALHAQALSGDEILKRVDQNMFTESRITVLHMVISGERGSRTLQAKSWQRGTSDAFTEFLAPPRDQGTKMLKLQDMLWTYSPSTDRTILISGHMLRQSMMGSDLSYEDMMEDPHLPNLYSAGIAGEDTAGGRQCWVLDLTARKQEVSYFTRKLWVDKTRYIPLRENLYAKSGKLLKTMDVRAVKEVERRWVATAILYKDVLKEGGGTDFFVDSVALNVAIPGYILSKAALRK